MKNKVLVLIFAISSIHAQATELPPLELPPEQLTVGSSLTEAPKNCLERVQPHLKNFRKFSNAAWSNWALFALAVPPVFVAWGVTAVVSGYRERNELGAFDAIVYSHEQHGEILSKEIKDYSDDSGDAVLTKLRAKIGKQLDFPEDFDNAKLAEVIYKMSQTNLLCHKDSIVSLGEIRKRTIMALYDYGIEPKDSKKKAVLRAIQKTREKVALEQANLVQPEVAGSADAPEAQP